jgi:hypothetical protein
LPVLYDIRFLDKNFVHNAALEVLDGLRARLSRDAARRNRRTIERSLGAEAAEEGEHDSDCDKAYARIGAVIARWDGWGRSFGHCAGMAG